ncbi:putative Na+-transporting ATPase ENA-1 [Serendipita vermifera]|nr:putative Na+-transporting ATPase ENA-1 [Serendipita vermifera]
MSASASATVVEKANSPHPPPQNPPHIRPAGDILREHGVDMQIGLSTERAAGLLAENGPNQIKPPQRPSKLKILLAQVTNAMTIVLLGAMAVSLGTKDWIATGVIGALVVLNVSVGFTQEWKAEKVLAGLASVGSPLATVVRHESKQKSRIREGKSLTIPTEEVVVGDIIIIKIGDVVPADARIIPGQISNLECDESLLTGESLPVAKTTEPLTEADCPVGDRTNMVYSGSQVTKGRAKCIVTMTGMNTELGKIAEALERKEGTKETGYRLLVHRIKIALGIKDTTPLQMKMNQLAYWLLLVAIILAVIVVSSTGYRNIPNSIATYAVAAAVSLLPASLFAVVSLTLAVACRELAARNALVRRMDAVETLGGVHNICSDKTGTITVGRMVLKKVWIPANAAFVPPGTRADYEVERGQTYVVESGRDPYYPRGIIRATGDVEPAPTPNSEDDNNDEESDDVTADDIVRIESLEPAFQEFIHSAALNNMATIHKGKEAKEGKEGKGWDAHGDPTEIALQVFAHKAGRGKPHLTAVRRRAHNYPYGEPLGRMVSRASANIQSQTQLKRIHTTESDAPLAGSVDGHYEMLVEHPFDSTIKRMSTVWQFIPEDTQHDPADYDLIVYVKGAVERILDRCTHIGIGENKIPLTEQAKERVIERMDILAAEGLRVLCLAEKHIPHAEKANVKAIPRDELENNCCFLGLAGIYDPPRPESYGAVMDALRAGIAVRMLTGDHSATAASIARSVGILNDTHGPNAVMTGQQFDALTDDQIDAIKDLPVVVARCAPETKVRMVEALHRRKEKTVMTGDGVNDSPALKRADVGVAMGLNGSDVAKGAADIVLADDNFSTIVRAIRKGRSVFQNLAKFLVYLLSGNVAEVVVIMIGLAFRRDGVAVYPIAPVAALWVNTIAAGPPALALGVEPTAKDAMDIGPENFQSIFTLSWYLDTIGYGVFIGAQSLANFVIVQYGTGDGMHDILPKCNDHLVGMQEGCEVVFKARGTAFATLQLILMVHAITCKHLLRSIFHMRLLDNPSLLWSAGCLALTTFPILYIPAINDRIFQLSGITWQWGLVVGQLVLYLVAAELYKLVKRTYYRRRAAKKEMNPVEALEKRTGTKFHVAYTMDP